MKRLVVFFSVVLLGAFLSCAYGQCGQCPQGFCKLYTDATCTYSDCDGCSEYYLKVPCNAQYLWQYKIENFTNACSACITILDETGTVVLSAGDLDNCQDYGSGAIWLTCDNDRYYKIRVCLNVCNNVDQEVNCTSCANSEVRFGLFFTSCTCCQ